MGLVMCVLKTCSVLLTKNTVPTVHAYGQFLQTQSRQSGKRNKKSSIQVLHPQDVSNNEPGLKLLLCPYKQTLYASTVI